MRQQLKNITATTTLRFRELSKKTFVHNVIVVAMGTAGAQVIGLALMPLITRLYGPEAFGVLGVFVSASEILLPMAAMAYPIAIVLPKNDSDAIALVQISILILLFMAVLMGIVFLMFGDQISAQFGLGAVGDLLYLLPFFVVFSVLLQIAQQWLIRAKEFKFMAIIAISQAVALNVSKTVLGFINPTATVLVIITVLARALYVLLLSMGIRHEYLKKQRRASFTVKNLITVAKEYRDFPVFRAPQGVLNKISHGLPVLMLAMWFSPASAGFYSLARTALALPSMLISKSVSDVFYPRFAEAARASEDTRSLLIKANLMLAVLGIIPFGTIIIWGPWLFTFVFGAEWTIAGEYARWMAIWMYFVFINPPSLGAIAVLRLQRFFLLYEIASIILRVVAISIGYFLLDSDIKSVALFCLAGVILNIILILTTIYHSKKA